MKTIKQISVIALAIITLGIIAGITACNNDNPAGEQPKVQPDTPRTLSFGTAENPCTVTIKSDDQFTTAEWTTLCDKVVGALETVYKDPNTSGGSKGRMRRVFGDSDIKIILEKNPTDYTNYKVGLDFKTLYLCIDKIETANYEYAVSAMDTKAPNEPNMKD
jgi:hypothetical protein